MTGAPQTTDQAIEKAQSVGAVRMGTVHIDVRDRLGRHRSIVYQRHFFNQRGDEVAYWMPGTLQFKVFDEPREWSALVLDTVDEWRDL